MDRQMASGQVVDRDIDSASSIVPHQTIHPSICPSTHPCMRPPIQGGRLARARRGSAGAVRVAAAANCTASRGKGRGGRGGARAASRAGAEAGLPTGDRRRRWGGVKEHKPLYN